MAIGPVYVAREFTRKEFHQIFQNNTVTMHMQAGWISILAPMETFINCYERLLHYLEEPTAAWMWGGVAPWKQTLEPVGWKV